MPIYTCLQLASSDLVRFWFCQNQFYEVFIQRIPGAFLCVIVPSALVRSPLCLMQRPAATLI